MQKLEAMVESTDGILLNSKREAISTLFFYVILERGRQKRMANSISHALRAMDSPRRGWTDGLDYIKPYTHMLFCGPNTPLMDSLIILLSPYIDWNDTYHRKGDVIRWAAAASAVPYTEEVGQDIVSALLQISMYDTLRPHIPIEIWTRLKNHSILPPLNQGRDIPISSNTLRYIRGLRNIEILKSFLILAWSQDTTIYPKIYVKDLLKDFCGIGMWGHRKDLIERLEHVLTSRNRRGGYIGHRMTTEYERLQRLKSVLLEVETEAMNTLTRMLFKLSFLYKFTNAYSCEC